jgi:hypothetical protein
VAGRPTPVVRGHSVAPDGTEGSALSARQPGGIRTVELRLNSRLLGSGLWALAVSLLAVWLWVGRGAVLKQPDDVSANRPDKSTSGPQTTAAPRESVLLRFSVPGRSAGELVIPVGTMASVTVADQGTLGLSPVPSRGGVDLHVFRLDGDSPAGLSHPRELATVRLERGTTARLNPGGREVEFVWVRTVPPRRQAPSPSRGSFKQ